MFYDAERFSFVGYLKQEAEQMRKEVEGHGDTLWRAHADESGLPLLAGGRLEVVAEVRQKLPRTAELLDHVAGCQRARLRRLEPGRRLDPRREQNSFLRALMVLSEPVRCRLTVAGDQRGWRPGECLLINPNCRHEIWNESPGPQWLFELDLDPHSLPGSLDEYADTRSWGAWLREPLQYGRYLLGQARSIAPLPRLRSSCGP